VTPTVDAPRAWGRRRRFVACAAAVLGVVVVADPTDLVDTPLVVRGVPPTWWSTLLVPLLALQRPVSGCSDLRQQGLSVGG